MPVLSPLAGTELGLLLFFLFIGALVVMLLQKLMAACLLRQCGVAEICVFSQQLPFLLVHSQRMFIPSASLMTLTSVKRSVYLPCLL